jgi:hypothetical protein
LKPFASGRFINSKRFGGLFGAVLVCGFLLAGLWPFDFSPRNLVSGISEGKGLVFSVKKGSWIPSVGGLATSRPLIVSSNFPPAKKGEWTIAVHIRPAETETNGIPRFLTMTGGTGKEILYLGQWQRSLMVGGYASGHESQERRREIFVGEAFSTEKARWLTITSDRTGTAVYVDGALAERFPGLVWPGQESAMRGRRITLGNSPSGKSPWTGTILALALFEESLTERQIAQAGKSSPEKAEDFDIPSERRVAAFDFRGGPASPHRDRSGNGNGFAIPARLVFEKRLLAWPGPQEMISVTGAQDLAVNLLGFVPLGFFFSFWLVEYLRWKPRRSYGFVVLLGGFISLGIETIQAFIPARDSSLLDLLCNLSGTALGVLIFHRIRARGKPRA